jgi:ADP-ribosylglycohydrolase
VEEASRLTHNTGVAIAGAAAVAAAVSAGVEGWRPERMVEHALAAARMGQRRGERSEGTTVAERIEIAVSVGRSHDMSTPVDRARLLDSIPAEIGTSLATEESVPAAFAVASAAWRDPWLACRLAASLGDDSDTIAAMTGAILGAMHGRAGFPSSAAAAMLAANPGLDLMALARDLLGLRHDQGP